MPNEFSLEEITPQDLAPQVLQVVGATTGKLLRFRNAVLARAEVNKNGDELDEQALAQVAASLPLLPIDVEHDAKRICGYYTEAKANGALYTDGVIFAERFPEIAAGIQQGTHRQSIEAVASEAECSVCARVFKREGEYCEHLSSQRSVGAVRKLRGLKAVGGAVTRNPAGTDTAFDPSQLTIIASLQEPELVGEALSTDERSDLGDSDFALIQNEDGKKRKRFPIHDREHAANALSRLPQAKDLSDEERAQVERKAKAALKKFGGNPSDGAVKVIRAFVETMDNLRANPGAHYALSSPILAPLAYVPTPAWVDKAVAQMGTSNSQRAVTSAPTPKADDGDKSKAGDEGKAKVESSVDEVKQAILSALEEKFKSLEERVKAVEAANPTKASSAQPLGLTGIAWESESKTTPEKIQVVWSRV